MIKHFWIVSQIILSRMLTLAISGTVVFKKKNGELTVIVKIKIYHSKTKLTEKSV